MDSEHAGMEQEPTGPEFDTSFFPAPSPYYHRYSSRNLALDADAVISDVPGEPKPFRASELAPPNVDWIIEDGSYSVFGETWPIEEHLPTLQEMGLSEMFDHTRDRKESLQSLLRVLLLTYTQLLDSLLTPPPSLVHPRPKTDPPGTNGVDGAPADSRSDPERLTEHIRLVTINMHHLVNELRPIQARETLKLMLRHQIDRRKEKTLAVRQRCREVRATLGDLQSRLGEISSPDAPPTKPNPVEETTTHESIRNELAKLVDDI